jgi:hypothetical protein
MWEFAGTIQPQSNPDSKSGVARAVGISSGGIGWCSVPQMALQRGQLRISDFGLRISTTCLKSAELFFKWIKQHLRIKAFYGTSENAVKTQIWIAVSIYVLVAIVRKRLGLEASLYQILQILSITLFEKVPILQALEASDYQDDLVADTAVRLTPGPPFGNHCVAWSCFSLCL